MSTSSTFVDKHAAEQYLCGICSDVMTEPVQISCSESHIFCRGCIDDSIQSQPPNNKKCPSCNTKFVPQRTSKTIMFIQKQINNLQTYCPHHYSLNNTKTNEASNCNTDNSSSSSLPESKEEFSKQIGMKRPLTAIITDNGDNSNLMHPPNTKRRKLNNVGFCDWIGPYADLPDHIEYCPFELIDCSHCVEKITRMDMSDHLKECKLAPITCSKCKVEMKRWCLSIHLKDSCPMTMAKCKQCGMDVIRQNIAKHVESECGETMIECKYKKYGCDNMKRKDKNEHNTICMEQHLDLIEKSHNELNEKYEELALSHNDLIKRVEQIENDQKKNINQQNDSLMSKFTRKLF